MGNKQSVSKPPVAPRYQQHQANNPNLYISPMHTPSTQNKPKKNKIPREPNDDPLDEKEYDIIPAIQSDINSNLNDFIPTELLLFGYIREIEQQIELFKNIQTPMVIIHLIQSFFDISFNYQYIFVAALKRNPFSTEMIVHELSTKKNLEITFSHQNNSIFWKNNRESKQQDTDSSFCGISNISIPEWIQQKEKYKTYFDQIGGISYHLEENRHSHYHIIAGIDDKKCGLLAINTQILDREVTVHGISNHNFHHHYYRRTINGSKDNPILSEKAKWINLPLLRSMDNNAIIDGTLIAKRYNLLYLGGLLVDKTESDHSKSIYLLNWATDKKLKWVKLPNELNAARVRPSGCLIYEKVDNIYSDMISNEKIAIIGGYNVNNGKTLKSVELLSFEDGVKTQVLASMKYGRSECGICTTNDETKRMIVGGGNKYNIDDRASEFTTKSVEFYDINKDEWLMVNSFTQYMHRYKPRIWVLPNEPNIIYIAGDFRNGINEMGMIEYCDIREQRPNWRRHGEIDFFKIREIMRFRDGSDYCPIQVTL